MKFLILALCLFLILVNEGYPQTSDLLIDKNKIQNLKEKILNKSIQEKQMTLNIPAVKSKKAPGLALLFSLILPGAGHYYINRMDVGKYFLGVDIASWIGLASFNIYGDNVRDDARIYSTEHAKVSDIENKPDDYFANIGNFNNIYEFNNDKLLRGEYGLLYDVNKFYWSWDNVANRDIYETQRKNSERIYNTRIVFGSLLIVNRIVSGISSYLLANKQNKISSLNVEPQLLYKRDYSFDGIKINVSKNF